MVKQKEAESQYSDCLAARHRDGSEWKPTDTDKIHTPLQHLLQTNKPLDLSFSKGFPGGTTGKESICQCRRCKRQGFDPWVRKKPWGRKYHLLQYSSLGNPMNRGAWWAIVHGITESDVTEQRKKVSWGVNLNTLHRLMKSSQSAFLLQGIFLTQGSNPCLLLLLHWQADSLPLGPPGKPLFLRYKSLNSNVLKKEGGVGISVWLRKM